MRRGVVIGSVVALAGAGVGIALVSSGADDADGRGAGRGTTTTAVASAEAVAARDEIAARRAVAGSPAEPSEALAALRTGIAGLRAQPGIDARCAVRGADAGSVEATTTVDPTGRAYDSRETTAPVGGSSPITEERRLLAGTLYVRAITAGVDPAQTRWDSVPLPTGDAAELDRSLTSFGRIADSLDRVGVLVEQVSGKAEILAAGGVERGFRFTIPARRIGDFYLRTGLEVLDHPPEGTTTFEVGVDASGALVRLAVYGTTFHDGEALEDSFIECRYSVTTPPAVAAPPIELIRP